MESLPVPKLAPTAMRDQNSYVAQRKGMIPMMNIMVLVVPDSPSMLAELKSDVLIGDDGAICADNSWMVLVSSSTYSVRL